MSTPVLIIAGIAILIVLVIVLRLMRRAEPSDDGELIDVTPVPPPAPAPAPPPPPAITGSSSADGPQDNGVADQIAAAMKDIAGEMAGVEAQPDTPGEQIGPAPAVAEAKDALILIKGLGPKAIQRLDAMGIVRFEQIAAWSDAESERIEAELGVNPGRVARDRWVEQAGYLARGDKEGFQEKFGRLR